METPILVYTTVVTHYLIGPHNIYITKENDNNGKPERVSVIFRYRAQENADYSPEEIEELKRKVSEILRLPVGRAVYDPLIHTISFAWDYNQRMPDAWGIPDALINSDDKTIFADAQKVILRLTRPTVKWSVIMPDNTVYTWVNTRWDGDQWVVDAISGSADKEFSVEEWQSLEELNLPFA